jgi:hypothetical protein
MKQDRSSLYRALFLILGCIVYRLASGMHPEALPNISPMIAVALVGTMYLPRAWGWLIAPVAFVVTELAFLATNHRADGFTLSWSTLAFLVFYVLVGRLGLALARNKSLLKVVAGSIVCSLVFYVLGNTFAWLGNSSRRGPSCATACWVTSSSPACSWRSSIASCYCTRCVRVPA